MDAQTINVCEGYCNRNLSNAIFTDNQISQGQIVIPYSVSTALFDVRYEENNNCPGAPPITSTTCENIADALKYYVYYPINQNYENCPLPVLIIFHGGSFSECSNVQSEGIGTMCKEFAKRGFVVFCVEYRRGLIVDRDLSPDPLRTFTSAQQLMAIYRACQDGRGAIRSIFKRHNDPVATATDPYKVDMNNVFVGGISAGSVIAMASVYYQNTSQWAAVFPNMSVSLGPIDPANIYDDLGEPKAFYPKIRAVINCWGSLTIPLANELNPYAFFSTNAYNPPIISFHGKEDEVFNYVKQDIYFSPPGLNVDNLIVNTESNCVLNNNTYTFPDNNPSARDLINLGSQSIYEMFRTANPVILTEFYLDCSMGHGMDKCPQECPFDSDFGTGLLSLADVYAYIAGRGASFFQVIIRNKVPLLGSSKFVDCVNNRFGCTNLSREDNDEGCEDSDVCIEP